MRIKVVGVSGSPIKGGNTEFLLEHALGAIDNEETETEVVGLAGKDIKGCIHCNWCVRKQSERKLCAFTDAMDDIYPRLLAADAILLATPVYFGRLSGLMADFIDRCRVAVHGKVYRHAFKNKIGAGLAVSYVRNGGIESTLISLHSAFLVLSMIPVGPGTLSFGNGALSSYRGEGACEKDDRQAVRQDSYGLRWAVKAAQRAVEVARLLKAGTESLRAGIA
jgi:multimeric flavodoxin WrbA